MPSTFLQLCNKTIRRLNEVEIAADDFGSVRGIQALVKDAVKDSIARINQAEFEWPFNAAEHTQLLVAGQTEYSWPAFFKISDYNSFQILKNEGFMSMMKGAGANILRGVAGAGVLAGFDKFKAVYIAWRVGA